MKICMIGGTGTISMAISRLLLSQGHTLYLLNRGQRSRFMEEYMPTQDSRQSASLVPAGRLVWLKADINNEEKVLELLDGLQFDVVADFIAFTPEQLMRDWRLFQGRTRQFVFISSASAYQKPLSDYRINEGTPLSNPYWEYSRNKIACEEYLMELYRKEGFPITIIRPSHTYDQRSVPLDVHGHLGSYAIATVGKINNKEQLVQQAFENGHIHFLEMSGGDINAILKRMQEGRPVIIHGDGTSLWTLTHSSDFARAFVGLLGNIHAIGEAVQITSDESLTWNQIYQIIADALDVKLNALYVSSQFLDASSDYDFAGSLLGDKANTVVFDNAKLKRLVPGFTATVRADQGLRSCVEYVLSHPECQKEDPEFDAWCDRVVGAMEAAVRSVKG